MTQKQQANLYESDYHSWCVAQAKLIKEKKIHEIDWQNILEEIETLGRGEKRELRNHLEILFMHLLKWSYQIHLRSNSWRCTIQEQRTKINEIMTENPGLKSYFEEATSKAYTTARMAASRETELNINTFPEEMPFSPSEALSKPLLSAWVL